MFRNGLKGVMKIWNVGGPNIESPIKSVGILLPLEQAKVVAIRN